MLTRWAQGPANTASLGPREASFTTANPEQRLSNSRRHEAQLALELASAVPLFNLQGEPGGKRPLNVPPVAKLLSVELQLIGHDGCNNRRRS